MFQSFISTTAAIVALTAVAGVQASMAPSYPSPGTVWTAGKPYTITWSDDNTSPSLAEGWTNFKIDFMTGDNDQQVFLENVASNLDATKIKDYTWTAPQVDPYSAVYFFMFTNSNSSSAWTTRFAIVAKDGDTPAAEPNQKQPNGDAIPWGTGKLANGASPAASSAAPASSSSAPASMSAGASSSGVAASGSSSAASSAAASSGDASSASSSASASASESSTTDSGVSALRVPALASAALIAAAGYVLA
ncbi:hypothetical protein BCR43DRAFT_490940 [Syncephalastrum racemosum]|uniref:Yeast cell wall synthesis Kre9/Knh1-like N-terminal domain-containing protein n=1 Tax=Syncephalastrum racemosum TaxID=13706 RepID=A0A1X2HGQ0_SYNRA|nr:hypothetical protein BCR43DRAFT_490940 [Syncephalastrum racemosum]